jgi:hypothetical protein
MKENNIIGSKINFKILFFLLLFVAGVTALAGAIIMTDLGQVFGIDKFWVVWYFRNSVVILIVSFIFLVSAIVFNWKKKIIRSWIIIVLSILWLGAFFSSKYLVPYLMFSAQQYDAEYVLIKDASDYLADDDIVFVVDYNGEQKAYPPKYMWQAHIFGGDYGKDNVVFTYCVLTNLPSPYINNIDGETVDFKVLAQTNNNLLIWDTKSGELIQQITQQFEFSEKKLDPLPVIEMTWAGFKKLYLDGTVLYNEWNRPMEKIMNVFFSPEEAWYGDQWMFKTANFDDKRLPSKEHIIGIRDDELDKQMAVTKDYIKQKGICNINVGDKRIALVFFPEYETIIAFDRINDGEELIIREIDVFGQTPENGKLERVFIYNSVLWAVWAHFYPDTEVLR